MKKIFYSLFLFLGILKIDAQDLISGGNNSWIFHTPDDGRTTMHITSMLNGSWQWDKETVFYNNGNIKFNGNIGIGTTITGNEYKLAVSGSVRAKEIKVETSWADFVFYKDYKLPTLEEVEKYIKEKGHLQDIPSSEEVEKNGIFLGDMNKRLLQKIEELMLYTIQQEKKLQKEKDRNDILEKRLIKLENLIENKKKR